VTHPSEFETNKAAGDIMDDAIKKLTQHDMSDDCPVCRTQDVVAMALMPAAAAWEMASELPRFSLALQGAAGLLGAMLEEGIDRTTIDSAISDLLDDIEAAIAEDQVMGGPPQGSA